ncbi:MAG: shikimate kinase [Actinobacteria bacterium]|nr:shikimate kinase [Actinomycetota bacterium]
MWLVGMMGSGKTTVGRALATRRSASFLDTDQMVEAKSGLSVTRIFEVEGETGFRQRESVAVLAAATETSAVVATGGGVVTRPENVSAMQGSGVVIWLKASVETLANRLEGVTDRPLLAWSDRQATLAILLAEREELYATAAEFTIDTNSLSPAEITTLAEAMWTG